MICRNLSRLLPMKLPSFHGQGRVPVPPHSWRQRKQCRYKRVTSSIAAPFRIKDHYIREFGSSRSWAKQSTISLKRTEHLRRVAPVCLAVNAEIEQHHICHASVQLFTKIFSSYLVFFSFFNAQLASQVPYEYSPAHAMTLSMGCAVGSPHPVLPAQAELKRGSSNEQLQFLLFCFGLELSLEGLNEKVNFRGKDMGNIEEKQFLRHGLRATLHVHGATRLLCWFDKEKEGSEGGWVGGHLCSPNQVLQWRILCNILSRKRVTLSWFYMIVWPAYTCSIVSRGWGVMFSNSMFLENITENPHPVENLIWRTWPPTLPGKTAKPRRCHETIQILRVHFCSTEKAFLKWLL